jgi:tRNA nucleotidyltransferase/poly(A) polymerase
MKLEDLLSIVSDVAKENGLSEPLMVGGVPRDRILGTIDKKSEIKDVDLTTGNKDSVALAKLVHAKLPSSSFNVFDDGHSAVDFMGIHFDFSSNFVVPVIDKELQSMGVKNIDSMKRELYSRDFTINTLLEKLDFTGIYDLTGEAIDDIKAGVIKCPINPEITIGYDPRRILRAIKFAIKYDMKIEEGLKSAMLNNRHAIQDLPQKFVQDKINEIVVLDADKGIELLLEFKLLPLVPLTKTVSDILIQKRQLIRAL